ncbi:hypothetical protein ACJJTC_006433 [Scirpophaga incertulas]
MSRPLANSPHLYPNDSPSALLSGHSQMCGLHGGYYNPKRKVASSAIPEQNKVEAYSGKAIDTAIPEHISQAQANNGKAADSAIPSGSSASPQLSETEKRELLIQNWTLVGKQRRPLSHSDNRKGNRDDAANPPKSRKDKKKEKMREKRRKRRLQAKLDSSRPALTTANAVTTGSSQPAKPSALEVNPQGTKPPQQPRAMPGTSKGSAARGQVQPAHGKAKAKRARLDETLSPRGNSKKPKLSQSAASNLSSYASVTKKGKLRELVLRGEFSETAPGFGGRPTYVDGNLQLLCADVYTVSWLKEKIAEFSTTHSRNLAVFNPEDLKKRILCGLLLPLVFEEEQSMLGGYIRLSNPWAKAENWVLHSLQKQPKYNKTFVMVGIPEDSVPAILERGRRIRFHLGYVYVLFRDAKGRFIGTRPLNYPADTSGAQTSSVEPSSETREDNASTMDTTEPSESTPFPLGEEELLALALRMKQLNLVSFRRAKHFNNLAEEWVDNPLIHAVCDKAHPTFIFDKKYRVHLYENTDRRLDHRANGAKKQLKSSTTTVCSK